MTIHAESLGTNYITKIRIWCWQIKIASYNLEDYDKCYHYIDVIRATMASQITSLTIVYSIVHSDADQRKHQSSVSLAFVWGIHRDRWIPRTKGQLRGKCFHLMTSSWSRKTRKAKQNKFMLSDGSSTDDKEIVVKISEILKQKQHHLRYRDQSVYSPNHERWHYILTQSVIGWAHTANDPWNYMKNTIHNSWNRIMEFHMDQLLFSSYFFYIYRYWRYLLALHANILCRFKCINKWQRCKTIYNSSQEWSC